MQIAPNSQIIKIKYCTFQIKFKKCTSSSKVVSAYLIRQYKMFIDTGNSDEKIGKFPLKWHTALCKAPMGSNQP
jgi:hypothetical protein